MGEHLEVSGDGLTVVTLTGELDAHDAPRLRELVLRRGRALQGAERGEVLLDLTQVTFLDSTVLGSIVGLVRRVREADGELGVVLPRGTALRIFEITGLDAILTTYPTRAAALGD